MSDDELQGDSDDRDDRCPKCALLAEFYAQVPKTPRNYWVMTELVVFLHGSDVCDYHLEVE